MIQTSDIRRIAVVLTTALLLGWAIGNVTLALLVALALYCVWLHRNLARLLSWIRDRKHADSPEPQGVFEEMCREIDYLRERHKKRKKKLGSYLKQYRQATRALPDGTVVLDKYGAVKWANKAAADYLGIRWPDDVDQRLANLVRIPELVEFMGFRGENASIDIVSPIDPGMQLNVRLTPYGNGQHLFVARDVTQLHRANQIRSDFVANVSHELRTPITVLRGYLENMNAQREQCPPSWQRPLEQMSDHVGRMQAIVEDLLMLSQLEQKDRVDNSAPVPVAELLVDIHRQSQRLNANCDPIFALEIDTDLEIYGSARELYSCFSNLVYNAVHYTGKRGVIEIHWYRDEDGAHLSIKDNGVGIGAEHIARLTERFYRVDPSRTRSAGGTGLGLAIVKHILTRHGASLHIESELGSGSTFRCDFPLESIVDTKAADEIDQTA